METTTFDGIAQTLGSTQHPPQRRARPLRRRPGRCRRWRPAARRRRLRQAPPPQEARRATSSPPASAASRAPSATSTRSARPTRATSAPWPSTPATSDTTCSGGPGAFCGPKTDDLDDTAPFCAVGHRVRQRVSARRFPTRSNRALPGPIRIPLSHLRSAGVAVPLPLITFRRDADSECRHP